MSGPESSRIYVFGDQTYYYDQSLAQLLRSEDVHLTWFFRASYDALRTELGRLPPHLADRTFKHSSVSDLLTRKRDQTLSPALEQWLSCIHNIAAFIWQHSAGKQTYPTAQNSQLLGFCTGALAAAAISSAHDLDELVQTGVHAAIVALHVGLHATEAAKASGGINLKGEWSMIVHDASRNDFAKALESFNTRKSMPSSSHAYISSISASSSTVSAPPNILEELRQDPIISARQNALIRIRAPYHAPHLFSGSDVDDILRKTQPWAAETSADPIPVLSCGTGHAVWVTNSQAVMESAVNDVLTRPMLVEKTIENLCSGIMSSTTNEILVVPVGTDIGGTIKRRLESVLSSRKSASVNLSLPREVPATISPKGRSKIAVIGMSGRFPGAANPEALWQLLSDKLDMVREVPKMRWDVDTHVDPTGKAKNTSKVKWGCWLDDPDLFDAPFFSISPREAPQIDPAQRLALMTAYEAIEQAGVVPGRTPSTREDRVGVFYGVTSNDWCEANSGQDVDTYYIPGANRAFIPGRVNYFFKFSGPSYATDTACSSSLSAIHIACNSLWQKDIDMAIAGGTNVLTNPDMTTGLDKGHFLSTTGNCKTFDESADGYCRGEGVATLVLKRLEDAIEDSDPIYGIIGTAFTNHSAEAESITRPHVGAQMDIFQRVLSSSGLNPYDIGYIEMHGTGTQAGDVREINSVCDTFSPVGLPHKRPADQPLHLGALKANIGHGESVSGVSAMIKVMMMMRKGEIPPHCGIKTRINPKFPHNLGERNVHIDLESTPWPRARNQPRRAIINNFSAAGGNTSLLVEEAPAHEASEPSPSEARPLFPLTISARSAKSLKANVESLAVHISKNDVPLPALSYTTTARRMHHHFRYTVNVESIGQLKDKLADASKNGIDNPRIRPPKQMLFAFTGQGSQYPGMGNELLETLSAFREQIVHFDELAQRLGFPGFICLLHASRGDDIAAYPPVVVQLANTCIQIALARIWISWGIEPTAVVGHSLGEYAALNVAGVLSDVDTVFLVGRRAQLLQEMCEPGSHAMLAVQSSVENLKKSLSGVDFETACINGPQETVLSGRKEQVQQWKQQLTSAGVRNTLLQVPYAFHSSQITPIRESFMKDAEGVAFRKPRIPVLSPLHGSVVEEEGVFDAEYVVRHAREPVQMMKALQAASEAKILSEASYGIEFGPHPVVSGMIKSTLGPKLTMVPTLRNKTKAWTVMTQSLSTLHDAGVPIKWDGYYADIPSARVVLELPAYSWELRSHWIKYRNDWTLTKGDIPIDEKKPADEAKAADQPAPKTSSKPKAKAADKPATSKAVKTTEKPSKAKSAPTKLESSTIQKVLSEDVTEETYTVSIECDAAREDVKPFIQSHTVDGYSLCTPAVYADIGFTIGNYVLDRFQPDFLERNVTVNGMDIHRALIGNAGWKQSLRCKAKVTWATKSAALSFTVHDENGKEVAQCATCTLGFTDDSERQALISNLPTLKGNFERLNKQADGKGNTARISGPDAYKLVSGLADFNPDYHCVDDVLYDHDEYECAQRVSFGKMKKGGDFYINPGMVDGLTQSAGFAMNVNEKTKLESDVFVNHGWKEFYLFEEVRDDCQYYCQVHMGRAGGDGLWSGDISVYTGDTAVAVVKGCQIQWVQRRYLKFILSQAAKAPKWLAKPKEDAAKAPVAKAPEKKAPAPKAPEKKAAAPKAPETKPAEVKKAPTPAPAKETPPPAAPVVEATPSNDEGTAKKALEIIAEQSGVELSELTDDTLFSDLGVDSLLSLMITSQFAEDLGVEADPNFFEEYTSVAEVKKFFGVSTSSSNASAPPAPEATEPDSKEEVEAEAEELEESEEAAESQDLKEVEEEEPEEEEPEEATSAIGEAPIETGSDDGPDEGGPGVEVFEQVRQIIADETQIPLDELTDDSGLADLGIDSLLSLMIGSRLRDELDIDYDTQNMSELENVRALREAMFPGGVPSSSSSADSGSDDSIADAAPVTPPSEPEDQEFDEDVPPTTSVVLQGNSKRAKNVLWIFPDGSGLASSYTEMSRIREDLVVYGMNSPYLKKGETMHCSWDAMVKSYITEIKRRQPSGPYSFAGWSAGGILAYRASQMLMNAGENVRDLIILDSPPPFNLTLLPEHFFEYCSSAGLLGNGKGGGGSAPKWLIEHFRSINGVLKTYAATPLGKSTLRKVNILWATESSVDETFYGQADDPRDMKFLTVKRTDYSAGDWGPLFEGKSPVKVDLAEGQHHWSLLKGDSAKWVAKYIREQLA